MAKVQQNFGMSKAFNEKFIQAKLVMSRGKVCYIPKIFTKTRKYTYIMQIFLHMS